MKKTFKMLWVIVKYFCTLVFSFCGGYGAATLASKAKTKPGKILGWCTLVPAGLIGGHYAGEAVGAKFAEDWCKVDVDDDFEEEPEEDE